MPKERLPSRSFRPRTGSDRAKASKAEKENANPLGHGKPFGHTPDSSGRGAVGGILTAKPLLADNPASSRLNGVRAMALIQIRDNNDRPVFINPDRISGIGPVPKNFALVGDVDAELHRCVYLDGTYVAVTADEADRLLQKVNAGL
jgi:hypothetical protein